MNLSRSAHLADALRKGDAMLSQPFVGTPASVVHSSQGECTLMDMKLNPALIRQEREKRAWSQEHLADVSGLALRTIQRIESSGSASYESATAIAAVFDLPVATLRTDEAEPAVSAAVSAQGARRWLTWHRVATLLGFSLLAAVFTPPHFRVTIPAAVILWLSCELAIKTRRPRPMNLS